MNFVCNSLRTKIPKSSTTLYWIFLEKFVKPNHFVKDALFKQSVVIGNDRIKRRDKLRTPLIYNIRI